MRGDDLAVIQFDQGSFPRLKSLDWPANIIPIFPPPHSSYLHPIERVWLWLKRQLQWENCDSLIQLRQNLSEILAQTTPEQIISLTSYDFILEALFGAVS